MEPCVWVVLPCFLFSSSFCSPQGKCFFLIVEKFLYRFRSTKFNSNWNRKWCGRPTLALPSYISLQRRWGSIYHHTLGIYKREARIHYPRAASIALKILFTAFVVSFLFCFAVNWSTSGSLSFCCNRTCLLCVIHMPVENGTGFWYIVWNVLVAPIFFSSYISLKNPSKNNNKVQNRRNKN